MNMNDNPNAVQRGYEEFVAKHGDNHEPEIMFFTGYATCFHFMSSLLDFIPEDQIERVLDLVAEELQAKLKPKDIDASRN